MKQTIASLVLAFMLFPTLALGETVKMDDLVITNGLYYKKFTTVPFTGKVEGNPQGSFKNGKRVGTWIKFDRNGRVEGKINFGNGELSGTGTKYRYHSNGQVKFQETYKDDKKDGPWVAYNPDGTVWENATITRKDGIGFFEQLKREARQRNQTKINAPTVDAIRRQIEPCWRLPLTVGHSGVGEVEITASITPDGVVRKAFIVDRARATKDPLFRAIAESAARAMRDPRCQPLKLPLETYDQWQNITLIFHAGDMN